MMIPQCDVSRHPPIYATWYKRRLIEYRPLRDRLEHGVDGGGCGLECAEIADPRFGASAGLRPAPRSRGLVAEEAAMLDNLTDGLLDMVSAAIFARRNSRRSASIKRNYARCSLNPSRSSGGCGPTRISSTTASNGRGRLAAPVQSGRRPHGHRPIPDGNRASRIRPPSAARISRFRLQARRRGHVRGRMPELRHRKNPLGPLPPNSSPAIRRR
jgi:hypothetical protein